MTKTNALHTPHSNGNARKIVAIIPAHNEVGRVGDVVRVIKNMTAISRVVVVDDGSTDGTSNAAEIAGADVIRLQENRGKAAAMNEGVIHTTAPIILFLDADLLYLDEKHINDLLAPVLNSEVEMTMGVFRNGRFRTDIAHRISPGLSGQRAMIRDVWHKLDTSRPMEEIGYGIERELQDLVRDEKVTLKVIKWKGVSQRTKEEKLGPQKGFMLRMRMYVDIVKTWGKRVMS